jgi:hypothetical protein
LLGLYHPLNLNAYKTKARKDHDFINKSWLYGLQFN